MPISFNNCKTIPNLCILLNDGFKHFFLYLFFILLDQIWQYAIRVVNRFIDDSFSFRFQALFDINKRFME